jgi:hypothetical protein
MRMCFAFVFTALSALVAVPLHGGQAKTFGVAPSLADVTPIAQVLAKPSELEGKTVRVEGVVTSVCTEMGCWMALAPSDAPGGSGVLVKVDDGVIVFPVSAKGKRAAAQGVVQRVGAGDREGQEAAREHEHQEARRETAAATRWQIKATGAIVY